MDNKRLLRELAVIIGIKLLLIVLLWWAFFSDVRVDVTPARAMAQMTSATTQNNQGVTKNGE